MTDPDLGLEPLTPVSRICSAGRRCRPELFVISTWRRATVGSWLIGGSVGLGRGQETAGLFRGRRRPDRLDVFGGYRPVTTLRGIRLAAARRPSDREAVTGTGRPAGRGHRSCRGRIGLRTLNDVPWSASSSSSITFSRVLAWRRKLTKRSSFRCREIFSSARRWSPGWFGGEISRKKMSTGSPSRAAKSTPRRDRATVPIRR